MRSHHRQTSGEQPAIDDVSLNQTYAHLFARVLVGPDVALALSLARRLREVPLGLPTLVVWQVLEWRTSLTPSPRCK
jgi:hypothetical protein